MKLKLSAFQIQELIVKYINKVPVAKLCKEYGRTPCVIYNILKQYKVPTHNKMSNKTIENISSEEINQIVNLYATGISSTKVGKIIGISHTLVLKIIEKYSTLDHSRISRVRVYKDTNQTYFDTIDAEDKAYFLGLMFADGCNDDKWQNNAITITLQEKDKHILETFKDFISPSQPLRFVKKAAPHKNCYCLSVCSKYLSAQLTKLGCVPRKSLVLEWPAWLIDPELQKHFIRGYFDGDGSLSVGKNKDNQYSFKITSMPKFCQGIEKVIKSQLDINFRYDLHSNGKTTNLCTGGNRQVLMLMDWLYKDANYFLHRKHQKYLDLTQWCQEVDTRLVSDNRHINQYY